MMRGQATTSLKIANWISGGMTFLKARVRGSSWLVSAFWSVLVLEVRVELEL